MHFVLAISLAPRHLIQSVFVAFGFNVSIIVVYLAVFCYWVINLSLAHRIAGNKRVSVFTFLAGVKETGRGARYSAARIIRYT